ncbi:GST3 [Scenedesmus sp. PABB004]|nr:GST3 [Scenedesmus sp. PABB004]
MAAPSSLLQRTARAPAAPFRGAPAARGAARAGRAAPPRAAAGAAFSVDKPTLIDVPVSNHGARVRHIIYAKGLEGEIDIASPAALGGLGSAEYQAANPQGKMPVLLLPGGGVLPESEVIAQYLIDRWAGTGPAMTAATPELRAVAALAARLHDQYITPIQACMYRKQEPVERAALLAALVKQLDVLEGLCVGPNYIAGDAITAGDSALFPTFVFCTYILPRYFGWPDVFAGRPKLAAWWAALQRDPHAKRVMDEVAGGLEGWSAKGRWEELGITQQLREHPELKWVYP